VQSFHSFVRWHFFQLSQRKQEQPPSPSP
jgi:hypothetical protein